ncbi:hypothetical protein [Acetobacter orientalis]
MMGREGDPYATFPIRRSGSDSPRRPPHVGAGPAMLFPAAYRGDTPSTRL